MQARPPAHSRCARPPAATVPPRAPRQCAHSPLARQGWDLRLDARQPPQRRRGRRVPRHCGLPLRRLSIRLGRWLLLVLSPAPHPAEHAEVLHREQVIAAGWAGRGGAGHGGSGVCGRGELGGGRGGGSGLGASNSVRPAAAGQRHTGRSIGNSSRAYQRWCGAALTLLSRTTACLPDRRLSSCPASRRRPHRNTHLHRRSPPDPPPCAAAEGGPRRRRRRAEALRAAGRGPASAPRGRSSGGDSCHVGPLLAHPSPSSSSSAALATTSCCLRARASARLAAIQRGCCRSAAQWACCTCWRRDSSRRGLTLRPNMIVVRMHLTEVGPAFLLPCPCLKAP